MIAEKCTLMNAFVMHTDACEELGWYENQRLFHLALCSHAIILWDNGGSVGFVTRAQLKEMHRVFLLNAADNDSEQVQKKRHVPSVFWDDCEHVSEIIGALLLGKEHELDYNAQESDDQTDSRA